MVPLPSLDLWVSSRPSTPATTLPWVNREFWDLVETLAGKELNRFVCSVHGSAPDIEGRGIANPIATIR